MLLGGTSFLIHPFSKRIFINLIARSESARLVIQHSAHGAEFESQLFKNALIFKQSGPSLLLRAQPSVAHSGSGGE